VVFPDVRRQAGQSTSTSRLLNTRRNAAWVRLIQKVYEVDPLACVNCGSNMRIIALIDDVDVVERILKHLKVWDPQPDTLTPAGPDPPQARLRQ
jgi:hypothetical protein